MTGGSPCGGPSSWGCLASTLSLDGPLLRAGAIRGWLAAREGAHRFSVRQVAFAELDSWAFEPITGNLTHASGRFFKVEGVSARTDYPQATVYCQPIINQPEVGILGMLAKRFDGVLHFLIQAKMEAGNIAPVQLSPTVQATKSNYTQVHRGRRPPYLDFFLDGSRGRILVDRLQSEQGSFFLRKQNRNMVVETTEEVAVEDDFLWMTLGQIKAMLRFDNLVNMDTRTVISSLPLVSGAEEAAEYKSWGDGQVAAGAYEMSLVASTLHREGGHLTNSEVMAWFTGLKSSVDIEVQSVPLMGLPGWRNDGVSIFREDRAFFSVIAVAVEADNREVPRWSQPIIQPGEIGMTAFVTQRIGGVLHFLVQARIEPGAIDMEMAPTVQHVPGSAGIGSAGTLPPFFHLVANAPRAAIRYDSVQSEEGGRFYHFRNRNIIIELDAGEDIQVPRGYAWMTLGQINEFLHDKFFNIEARGLLACLSLNPA